MAEYVTIARLEELGVKKGAVIERDGTFGTKGQRKQGAMESQESQEPQETKDILKSGGTSNTKQATMDEPAPVTAEELELLSVRNITTLCQCSFSY